jgi:hypothetical protein
MQPAAVFQSFTLGRTQRQGWCPRWSVLAEPLARGESSAEEALEICDAGVVEQGIGEVEDKARGRNHVRLRARAGGGADDQANRQGNPTD